MRTRLALTTGFATLSLLTLAACSPGTGTTGSGSTGGDGSSGGAGGAACLDGTWQLDTDDIATQLQQYFVDNGTPVSSTETDGTVTLDVDGTAMTYDSAVTYTMTADMGDGLTMVVEQKQTGESTGSWSIDGTEVVFSDWTNGITIDNTITINGEAAGAPIELPADSGSGVPMAIDCSGDTLTTKPDASPFTSTWARVG